jgi:hypothetical protein
MIQDIGFYSDKGPYLMIGCDRERDLLTDLLGCDEMTLQTRANIEYAIAHYHDTTKKYATSKT